MQMAEFLLQIYPRMIKAANQSDLLQMQELVNVRHHILRALQVLVDVEKLACMDINRVLY